MEGDIAMVKAMEPPDYNPQIMARIEKKYKHQQETRKIQNRAKLQENISRKSTQERTKVKFEKIRKKAQAMLELINVQEHPIKQSDKSDESEVDTEEEQEAEEEKEAIKEVNVRPDCKYIDPCTGQELASLEALEKRIREIKREQNITPVGLYGVNNNTTNYEFLTEVFVNPKISLDDMVAFKLSKDSQVGSDIYEVLARLFVFFGGISGVNPRDGGNYKFMDKVEKGGKRYETAEEALKSMKCVASKGSGVSDITLVNVNPKKRTPKTDDPYCEFECIAPDVATIPITKTYLMSVKWRKNERNAEKVDLEKLRIAQDQLSRDLRPADSIVFIRSKKDFQIANNRMFRQYVQHLAKTFFGWNEDVKPFLEGIRRGIFELANLKYKDSADKFKEALLSQYFNAEAKPGLSLQLHQDIIVKGLCDRIDKSDDNLYLIGVLPRGGKTFIAGGIIREYLQRNSIQNFNILWLTAAPNETMTQVRDELLNKFQDFNDFEFIDIRTNGKLTDKPHAVYFCSSQLLIASEKPDAKERKFLQNLKAGTDKLSLVFFDEAHKTGTGDMTKEKLQML